MSNEELQKAIDDITKDGGDPSVIAPAAAMPDGAMPDGMMPTDGSAADAMPSSDAAVAAANDATPIAPPPAAPAVPEMPAAAAPDLGEGVTIGADGLIDVNTTTVAEKVSNIPTEEPPANLLKVKQDALRELFPLMDKLNIDPVQKFGLYKDIIDLTKEHSAVEEAHETVLQIANDQTRADALLELLEIIAGFKV